MPRTLKQVAVDMANAFTRWQLWQGGGSSTLSDLTDVELTDLQTDDVLQYDGNKWINAIVQGSGNVGAQVDTIWSNPSPLTAFAGQNITVNTDYDIFIIDFLPSNNSTIHTTMLVNKVFNRTYRLYCNSGSAQDQQYQRSFTIQNGYINFNDGLRPGIAWDNSLCIPTVIYGIKFAPIEQNLHEYSLEEKAVGKWIDEKQIYERTMEVNVIVAGSQYWFTICEILNIERVFSIICYDNNYKIITFEEAQTSGNNVQIWCNTPSAGRNIKQVIVQYTKTTD